MTPLLRSSLAVLIATLLVPALIQAQQVAAPEPVAQAASNQPGSEESSTALSEVSGQSKLPKKKPNVLILFADQHN